MPLPAAHADVTTPTGETIERGIAMATRRGRFIVQSRQGVQLVDVETSAVRPTSDGVFEIDTSAGMYVVTRRRGGCGCGKR